MSGVFIAGSGMYLPETVVTNDDMTKIVDTSDEWITQRTGIRERRLSKGESNCYMGARAAEQAVKSAGISAGEIDMIIATTCTPDYYYPSLACTVQSEIGADNAFCWDLNAACTGFIYALDVAQHYLATGKKNILIVSSEILSKQTDFADRSTCVLFGDGAGAVVVQPSDGLFASYLKSEGSSAEYLVCRAMKPRGVFVTDSDNPLYNKYGEKPDHFIKMEGKDVYRFAVKAMPEAVEGACRNAGIDPSQLDLVIPHQANLRIIEAAAKRLGIGMDKVYANVDRYGNMSSACIPVCMDELRQSGGLKPGDKIALVGFGAGLTYGAAVMEW